MEHYAKRAEQVFERFDPDNLDEHGNPIPGLEELVAQHDQLQGLADDDHTQYLKEKLSGGLASEVPEHDHSTSAQGGLVAGTPGTVIVQVDDANVDTLAATLDFEGDDFAITSSPSGEANISFKKAYLRENYDPDQYPSSADAMDDEFEGGGSLDAKWTLVNDPGINQTSFAGHAYASLTENTGTDNLAARVQMYQTPPTGTQTLAWVAKVALVINADAFQTEKGEFASVMLYLMNNTNSEYVSVKINISNIFESAGTLGFAATEKTGDAAFASNFTPVLDLSAFYYLKLVKSTSNAYTSANTYTGYMSKNGIIWHQIGTDSITFTTACDRVGLMFRRPKSQNGSPTAEVVVDFFRRTD